MIEDDKMYMTIAKVMGNRSYCEKRRVGAVMVKDRRIISDGRNGTPSGFENICELEDEEGNLKTKPYVLHAEANAITKIACSTSSSEDATLYITCSPCMECAKLIIQAKIRRVVYLEEHDTDGLEIIRRAGIIIRKMGEEDL